MGLLPEEVGLVDLLLNLALVARELLKLLLVRLSLLLVTNLFVPKDRQIDLGVLLLHHNHS